MWNQLIHPPHPSGQALVLAIICALCLAGALVATLLRERTRDLPLTPPPLGVGLFTVAVIALGMLVASM